MVFGESLKGSQESDVKDETERLPLNEAIDFYLFQSIKPAFINHLHAISALNSIYINPLLSTCYIIATKPILRSIHLGALLSIKLQSSVR